MFKISKGTKTMSFCRSMVLLLRYFSHLFLVFLLLTLKRLLFARKSILNITLSFTFGGVES